MFHFSLLLGDAFAVYEQTIGFRGRNVGKTRISYKNEGDGSQADDLYDGGYT